MPLFDAARKYVEREQELIVIAGKNYGCGSSRDWAAKGVRLLGVRVVVSESLSESTAPTWSAWAHCRSSSSPGLAARRST